MINPISMGAMGNVHGYVLAQVAERRPRTRRRPVHRSWPRPTSPRAATWHRAEFADFMLFAAGSETVARLLGWAASVLEEHPDQRAALAADEALIPNAVEELLRFEPPSPVQARWTTRPVDVHGDATIPVDAKVVLLTGAAVARRAGVRRTPTRFDIHRRVDQHVSLRARDPLLPRGRPGPHGGPHRPRGDAAPLPEWEVDRDGARLLYTEHRPRLPIGCRSRV